MMNTILLILFATALFGSYMFYVWRERHREVSMLPVEAGPTGEADGDFTHEVKVRMGKAAKQLNPDLQYFVVRNECMMPRGIMSGDVVGVRLFDASFSLADTREDDVLLIYLDDAAFRGNKIRIRGEKDNAEQVCRTYYYAGRQQIFSHRAHRFESIKGVVEEVYHLAV